MPSSSSSSGGFCSAVKDSSFETLNSSWSFLALASVVETVSSSLGSTLTSSEKYIKVMVI